MVQRVFLTALAVAIGLIVLFGALFPIPLLAQIRTQLILWASVVGVFALILAYGSILRVHFTRLGQMEKNWTASLLVIVSALSSLFLVLWQGPEGVLTQGLLNHVLVPGESALLALTVVTLVLSAIRILRTRRSFESALFILVAIVVLLGSVPYLFPPVLDLLTAGIHMFAVAGMRGLLLGVTLGVTLTGLRILMGMDRPYSDE